MPKQKINVIEKIKALLPNPPLDLELGERAFKLTILCVSTMIIVYLALCNPLGFTPDYEGYIGFFDWSRTASWAEVFPNPYSLEPGFMALAFLLSKTLSTSSYVFLWIVLIASAFKLVLLYKISSSIAYFLAMVLFFFKFFPLQDYNQLRGAIAIGFLMLVYYQWVLKNNLWLALAFSVCAVLFHYSSVAILPFLLLSKHRFSLSKTHAVGFGILSFVVLAASAYFLVAYLAPLIPRLGSYTGNHPAASSYWSPVFYPEFLLIALSIVFWRDCTANMKRVVTIQMVGFSIFYGLFDFATISIRLREIISIFWLFYVADYSKVTSNLQVAIATFVVLNIALGSYLFYFSNYLKY